MQSTKSWKALVEETDPDINEDVVVYEFSGDKKFKEKQKDPYPWVADLD